MKPAKQIREAENKLKRKLIDNAGPEIQKAVSEFCEETGLSVRGLSFEFIVEHSIGVEKKESMLSGVDVPKIIVSLA